jgi:metallo-beta-lactamase class B
VACLLASPLAAAPAQAQLTIRLTSVPATTPANAKIYVAGSRNGWDPAAPTDTMSRQPDGTYTMTLPPSVRGPIEFKFTLGSWNTVETTATGADVPNRTYTIAPTGAETLAVSVAAWRDSVSAARARQHHTATASVRVMSDSFSIPQLGRTRRVWVYLPPGYETSNARYRVLYMHDGQNVFDSATAFAGEWGVDETLDSLQARGASGTIVVAVDHGGDHRLDEYDPWKNPNPKLGGGEGDAYVEFLVHTLKPYVDAHYRTRRDRRSTGVAGSSMGGLISLYAALEYPDVFGAAGVFSCACWIARPHIVDYVRQRARVGPPPRLYFVVGELETASGEMVRDQADVVAALQGADYPVATSVRDLVVKDGRHAEWFWRREFPAAYEWMFPDATPAASAGPAAWSTTPMPLDSLVEGQRVRIGAKLRYAHVGVIQKLRGDTIVFLATEGTEHTRFVIRDIPGMQVSAGRGPTAGHLLRSAGIGVAAGMLGGLAFQALTASDGEDGAITKGGILGGVAGGVLALRFPVERWRDVWLR